MSDQWGAPPPQAPYEPQPVYGQGQEQPSQQQYTPYPPQHGQLQQQPQQQQQQQQYVPQQHVPQQQAYEQPQYEQPQYEQSQYEQQPQYRQQSPFEAQQSYEPAPQYEIPQQLRYEMPQQGPSQQQPPPQQGAPMPQPQQAPMQQATPMQQMQQLQPMQSGELLQQAQPQPQEPPQPPPPFQPSRGNGAARAGALASIVPVLGLVLSLVFTAAWCAAGYYAYTTLGPSKDVGCVDSKADYLRASSQMEQDAEAMSKSGVGSPAFTRAVKTYQADLTALVAELDADSARAADDSVKSAIQAVGADLTRLDTSLGDLATGNYAGASNVMQINDQLLTDYERLQSACGGSAPVGA